MKDRSDSEEDFESFLYIITHDLKTYSRAMRVIPEWIEEDIDAAGLELPTEVQDHVLMLGNYARGLDRMLDGLTELSRVGRLADPPQPIPLHAALLAAWERVPGRAGFALQIHDADVEVWAPPNDLDRLLFALLSNCVVHHDHRVGHASVFARIVGERVFLTVEDNGPGIPPDYRDKVFEPLYTLKPKDEVRTAGVGLSVARKVVQSLAGALLLEDAGSGRGLAAICDLPLHHGAKIRTA